MRLPPQREAAVDSMATVLEKTLKRQLSIGGRAYVLAISPDGLKLTLKGRRKGLTLEWDALVSGDAALAVALNASLGSFGAQPTEGRQAAHTTARTKAEIRPGKAKVARRVSQSRRAGPKPKRTQRRLPESRGK